LFIPSFCILIRISRVFCRHTSPLACEMGYAAAFTVNLALVLSQWQHNAETVSVHPLINAKHNAGQAANTIFQVISMTQQEIKPNLPVWWCVLSQPLFLIVGESAKTIPKIKNLCVHTNQISDKIKENVQMATPQPKIKTLYFLLSTELIVLFSWFKIYFAQQHTTFLKKPKNTCD